MHNRIFILSLLLYTLIITKEAHCQEKDRMVLIETTLGNMKVRLYNDTPKHRNMFLREAEQGYYDETLFYRVIKDFMIQGGAKDSKNAPRGKRIGYGNPDFTVDDEIKSHHIHKKGALCAPRQPDKINPFKQSDVSQFYIIQGRVYTHGELDTLEMAVNLPIKREIKKQYMTPEVRAKLKALKAEKKVKEFRAIAEPLKREMDAEFALHPKRLVFTPEQRKAYTTIGGYPEIDGDFTVFGEVVEGISVIDKIAQLKTDENDRPYTDVKIKIRLIK